jgi:hypothetical protein
MARGGHGLPKVSPGPAMLYPSTPCGWVTPYSRFRGGPPTGWVACGHLLPPWIPHAVRQCLRVVIPTGISSGGTESLLLLFIDIDLTWCNYKTQTKPRLSTACIVMGKTRKAGTKSKKVSGITVSKKKCAYLRPMLQSSLFGAKSVI